MLCERVGSFVGDGLTWAERWWLERELRRGEWYEAREGDGARAHTLSHRLYVTIVWIRFTEGITWIRVRPRIFHRNQPGTRAGRRAGGARAGV